ncbi:MAG: gliding motility-associated C-terminal domain-containing protein [Vicingaceae bacterium]|nr:MAG: gliding motility-associated C-terminal domain-containing protein [Vicingaceae bacterium]
MKYLKFLFVLLFLPMLYFGQNNLALNPSFEEFVTPCNFPAGAIRWGERVVGWSSPDALDPDYFNECRGGSIGIPKNDLGFEYAKDSKAYVGFHPYDSTISSNTEFLQGTLLKVLQKDTIYCISFWISHADSVHYYINAKHIGVWFINYKSGYPPTVTLNDSLPFIQQKIAFIPDTFYMENDSGWTELKTTYKAKGGETHFIIGNFTPHNQVNTSYKANGKTNGYKNFAYYYLDEVSIYRCNDTLPPPVPKDTAYLNLPTAFSPNGDGQNDVFSVLGAKYVQSIELRIYNRWGQEVFYTNQKETGWDGTFKGQPAPTGVYAYTLVATLPNGEVITKKGNVTLKR